MTTVTGRAVRPTHAMLSGLCAVLVGIGLARFAYTPLIPALIAAGWFTPSEAAYLGAANLAGFLLGALSARRLAARCGASTMLRAMMIVATASFFGSAFPLAFSWFFVWRVVSGVSGGVLMALAAPTVLPAIPPERRGLAGGLIFTGVGLGIAASGTLVPQLMRGGVETAWLGLGAIAAVLTAAAWHGWPADLRSARRSRLLRTPSTPVLLGLYAEYALNAFGLVPHMIFLVDFVARGLGRGLAAGAGYWVLFGLGAVIGPTVTSAIGARVGFRGALRGAFLIQAGAVALLLLSTGTPALIVSSVIVGAFVPGGVALVLGRIQQLLPGEPPAQAAAWSAAIVAFSLGQAAAAYGFSYLFAQAGIGYPPLFALAAAAFLIALAIDLAVAAVGRGRSAATGRAE